MIDSPICRLKDKVCIITGAASGLGEATAHLFASHGASLVLADVQDELGREVAAKIGAQAIYVHCDVSIEADVAAMLDTCIRHFGRLDVLYNNAAILSNVGPLADMDISKFDVAHAVNVRGVALGLKYGHVSWSAGVQSSTPPALQPRWHQKVLMRHTRHPNTLSLDSRRLLPWNLANVALG
ncbi:hypothetical protein O6H91_Y525600 [Diphasiastrum complanatum]|nr:hypothetical protein O6H91_Y525600 [Diphasiastrum complanatum]